MLMIPGRWFDNSKGGSAGGPRLDKCRAFTEEELASKEVQEGGWFNQVAFEVMRVGRTPSLVILLLGYLATCICA